MLRMMLCWWNLMRVRDKGLLYPYMHRKADFQPILLGLIAELHGYLIARLSKLSSRLRLFMSCGGHSHLMYKTNSASRSCGAGSEDWKKVKLKIIRKYAWCTTPYCSYKHRELFNLLHVAKTTSTDTAKDAVSLHLPENGRGVSVSKALTAWR